MTANKSHKKAMGILKATIRCIWCGRVTYLANHCVFCGGDLSLYKVLFNAESKFKSLLIGSKMRKDSIQLKELAEVLTLKICEVNFLITNLHDEETNLLSSTYYQKSNIRRAIEKLMKLKFQINALNELKQGYVRLLSDIHEHLINF